MIDIWSSTGLQLPRQIAQSGSVALPMEESNFLNLLEETVAVEPTLNGIWAEMVHLAHIWADIQDLNKAAVEGAIRLEHLNGAVETLSNKLNYWHTSLQPHLRPTKENLKKYAAIGLGSALVALHLGFHYYNEVLFYQFLAEDAHPSSISVRFYKEECKRHAASFCDLLYASDAISGCECLYIMVGHMLVVTSTVYIHTLLFSDSDEHICTARRRSERNFEILTRLQSYWVKLDDSLSRLKAFHNACTASIESSFCMDRWMLSFILEHGTQSYEKFNHDSRPSAEAISATPKSSSPDLTLQDWYAQTFTVN